jgi:hypothetical protein
LSSIQQANYYGAHHVGKSAGDTPNRVFERHTVQARLLELLGVDLLAADPTRPP